MKTVLITLCCTAGLLLAAAELDFSKTEICCATDRSPLSYRQGEEMKFTFTVKNLPVSDGVYLWWSREGDDGGKSMGKAPASAPAVVTTSLDRAGFVSVKAYLADKQGKPFKRTTKDWLGKMVKTEIAFYAGTAVEPEKLTDCGEPADFDAFWAGQKARLAAVPFLGKVTEKKVGTAGCCDVYAVSIPCAGPQPVTGYLTVPVGAKEKSLPAFIQFQGHGTRVQNPPQQASKYQISLNINAHGQKLGESAGYYKKFFASLQRPGLASYAFDTEKNRNPETAYFNGMALRVLRALEYLKSRPEWNGRTLTVYGNSQGGLQASWGAALDPAVTRASLSVVWCCDMAGKAKKHRLCGSWAMPYTPAIDYYDPVFMAKRIKNAEVSINRAGLGDYTSPPSGLAVFYNNLAAPRKSIRFVQGSSHGFVPKKSDVVVWQTPEKKK